MDSLNGADAPVLEELFSREPSRDAHANCPVCGQPKRLMVNRRIHLQNCFRKASGEAFAPVEEHRVNVAAIAVRSWAKRVASAPDAGSPSTDDAVMWPLPRCALPGLSTASVRHFPAARVHGVVVKLHDYVYVKIEGGGGRAVACVEALYEERAGGSDTAAAGGSGAAAGAAGAGGATAGSRGGGGGVRAGAEVAPGAAMARVRWLYAPEETGKGRMAYHATHELFLTNHTGEVPLACLDVFDVCTVVPQETYLAALHIDPTFTGQLKDTYMCRFYYDTTSRRTRQATTGELYPAGDADVLEGVEWPGGGGADLEVDGSAAKRRRLEVVAEAAAAIDDDLNETAQLLAEAADRGNDWMSGDVDAPVHAGGSSSAAGGAVAGSGDDVSGSGGAAASGGPLTGPQLVKHQLGAAMAKLKLSAVPRKLPCREPERASITAFLRMALVRGGAGQALYITGMPGLGKTALVNEVVRNMQALAAKGELKVKGSAATATSSSSAAGAAAGGAGGAAPVALPFRYVTINAMKLTQPTDAYTMLAGELLGRHRHLKAEAAQRALDAYFNSDDDGKPCTVLLVDEIDYLVTKSETIMYNLFNWPHSATSRLVLICISNTLDLLERLMPKIGSRAASAPIDFRPYSKLQLMEILSDRLHAAGVDNCFDPAAVAVIAARVATQTGDARRALQLAHMAAEVALHRCEATPAPTPAAAAGSDSSGSSTSSGGGGSVLVTTSHVREAIRVFHDSPVARLVQAQPPRTRLVLIGVALACRRHGNDIVCVSEVHVCIETTLRVKGLARARAGGDVDPHRHSGPVPVASAPGPVRLLTAASQAATAVPPDAVPVRALVGGLAESDVALLVKSASLTPSALCLPESESTSSPLLAAVVAAMAAEARTAAAVQSHREQLTGVFGSAGAAGASAAVVAGASAGAGASGAATAPGASARVATVDAGSLMLPFDPLLDGPRNDYWPPPTLAEVERCLTELHRQRLVTLFWTPTKREPNVKQAVAPEDLEKGLERLGDAAGKKLLA